MGATKIQTWFAMERSAVNDLFEGNGKTIALNYWREIERCIIYTLENHPHMVLQLTLAYLTEGLRSLLITT